MRQSFDISLPVAVSDRGHVLERLRTGDASSLALAESVGISYQRVRRALTELMESGEVEEFVIWQGRYAYTRFYRATGGSVAVEGGRA